LIRAAITSPIVDMPHLSPSTLTSADQEVLLRATTGHPRDHLIFSLALGTGLRLAEIVGLDVGDVVFPDGTPRVRVRLPTRHRQEWSRRRCVLAGWVDAEAGGVLELQDQAGGASRSRRPAVLLPIRPAHLEAEGAGGVS
jgi:integrase